MNEHEPLADAVDRFTEEGPALLSRRSPVDRSERGLVSRDYQPLTGRPNLIASWPLGAAPGDDFVEEPWSIDRTEFVAVQRNILTGPNLAPVEHAPTYLVVCGRGHVDEGETLTVRLSNRYFSGKPYEMSLEVTESTSTPFLSTTVEFAPDEPEYEDNDARIYPEYALEAKVTGGTGYLHPGTNVQLWSE